MSGGSGEGWDGYTAHRAPAEDRKAVDKSLRGIWQPGTFAGQSAHQEQQSRTKVYDAPSRTGGKRPAAKPVPAAKPKRKKSS